MADKERRVPIWPIYLLFMAFFVVYLVFSNQIIVSLDQTLSKIERIEKSELDEILHPVGKTTNLVYSSDGNIRMSGSKVYFNIGDVESSDDTLNSVTLSGFAACATELENPKRRTEILLIGEKYFYRIDAILQWSGDNGTYAKYGVQGHTNNFIVSFSALSLKKDTYHIGIFVWENEEVSGYADTQVICRGDGSGLYEYEPVSQEVSAVTSDDDNPIYLTMSEDPDALRDGYYVISGDAAKQNVDSVYSTAYVNFTFEDGTERTFLATLTSRNSWYNSLYDSQLYTYSHFVAKIPESILSGKVAQVKVSVENEGVSSGNVDSYFYYFSDTGYEERYTKSLDSFPYHESGEVFARSSNWNDISTPRDGYYVIKGLGWVVNPPSENPRIFVQFRYKDGSADIYPATVSRSNWAVEQWGEMYANSGYSVKISEEDIRREDVDMYILVCHGNTAYRTEEPISYIWQDGQFEINEKSPDVPAVTLPDITDSAYVTHTLWSDFTQSQNDHYQISGLAYVSGCPIDEPEIYVQLSYQNGSTEIYPATVSRNEWMVQHFGEGYAQSVYFVQIAKENVVGEDVDMRILVRDGETLYSIEEPIHYTWQNGQFVQQ